MRLFSGYYKVILVLLSFIAWIPSSSEAKTYKSLYTFLDFACDETSRATGCADPFPRCVPGRGSDVIQSCRLSGESPMCTNFTWEKCCAANCSILHGQKSKKFGECVTQCVSMPENSEDWSKRASKARKN